MRPQTLAARCTQVSPSSLRWVSAQWAHVPGLATGEDAGMARGKGLGPKWLGMAFGTHSSAHQWALRLLLSLLVTRETATQPRKDTRDHHASNRSDGSPMAMQKAHLEARMAHTPVAECVTYTTSPCSYQRLLTLMSRPRHCLS